MRRHWKLHRRWRSWSQWPWCLCATGGFPDLPDAKKVIEDLAARARALDLRCWWARSPSSRPARSWAWSRPGETTVIVGGVIAGQGEIDLLVLIGIIWACCVLGDTTSFFLGRRLGRDFILRHGPKVKISEERLAQVESYFERHGGKTILIGRFIGLVRALAPFVAGSSGLRLLALPPLQHHRLRAVGHALQRPRIHLLPVVRPGRGRSPGKATFAFGVTVAVIAVGGVYLFRRLRREEDRRRLVAWIEGKPLLRTDLLARSAGAARRDSPARGCGSCVSGSPRAASGSSSRPRWPSPGWASTCSRSTP